MRGVRTNRNQPDLDRLAAIDDPVSFVWEILPHAARSFAMSILMLRARHATAAAVAYLYCRMLDTYEDLSPPGERESALRAFAERMASMAPPPPIGATAARDDRERSHLLLIDRCAMVDQVYATLPAADRRHIADLVRAMADGMVWSVRRFSEQGGVLVDRDQLRRYCHHVIGQPILFTLLLVLNRDLTADQRRDALAASEMIQLANITRDIERDLERGVAYHPSLRPHLGNSGAEEPVRMARRELMALALPEAAAYGRLAGQLAVRPLSLARGSAVLLLLHTDRHYRWCARRVGHAGWRRSERTSVILLSSLLAVLSHRWSARVMRRVERDFRTAADAMIAARTPDGAGPPPSAPH